MKTQAYFVNGAKHGQFLPLTGVQGLDIFTGEIRTVQLTEPAHYSHVLTFFDAAAGSRMVYLIDPFSYDPGNPTLRYIYSHHERRMQHYLSPFAMHSN